jgi:hypothetical protein
MKHVEIEWVDANILHGWQASFEDCDLAESKESGYLVHEDKEKIIIARGYSKHGLYNSPMSIPKGCIKSIKELRLK